MAKLLADYRTKLDQALEDAASILDQPKKDAAIQEAVVWHSRHEPQVKLQDLSGNGTTVEFPVPNDWIDGASAIRRIESPTGRRPPDYVDRAEYRTYRTPTGLVIQFDTAPANGTTARVSYTTLHVVSLTVGTIPDHRFDAVCNLAAMIACQWLANRWSQTSDPTISADSVDHKSRASEYSSRVRELKRAYMESMGITDLAGPSAASATADWDQGYPWGADRLTHPRKGWDA